MKNKKVDDYFANWEGQSCCIEDENGEACLEVIENTRKVLQRHLKEVHKIEVALEW